MSTNKLEYVALIINYLKKRTGGGGGLIGNIWVSIFES